MFSVVPVKNSAASPPVTASGTVSMITPGATQLSNCAASTRNTITSAKAKVM